MNNLWQHLFPKMVNAAGVIMIGYGVFALPGCAFPKDAAPGVEQPFRDNTTWCGDPNAIQPPDNPYLILAESNVTRAMSRPDVFWLAWGYAAPESSRRGDEGLRERSVAEMDSLTKGLAEKPAAFWSLLTALEALRLFSQVPGFPSAMIDKWKKELEPSIQSNIAINRPETEWMCFAPNTLLQSAAILQLASVLYGSPDWAAEAARLVRKASMMHEKDGAFRYIHDSGASQIYFGFDSTFLGRYYQLSRDPLARELLIGMAGFSKDVLSNGLMEGASSPWWKHHWGAGGPIHGVEIVAGLSRDPLFRAVAQFRLKQGQPYYFSYIPMYFWDPTISPVPISPDLCRFNTNFSGLQLRRGDWQVVMPGKARGDTAVGCSVVSGKPFVFDGYLETVALPILGKNESKAHGGNSLMVIPEEVNRGTLLGNGWIATGLVFQPRRPYYGDLKAPPPAGWSLVQAWFADQDGLAGWIMAVNDAALPDHATPKGYLAMGDPLGSSPADPSLKTTGAIGLKIWGDGVKWAPETPLGDKNSMGPSQHAAWISLPPGAPAYGLSASPQGGIPMEVSLLRNTPVMDILIRRQDGSSIRLIFNASAERQDAGLAISDSARIFISSEDQEEMPVPAKTRPPFLEAYQLLVLFQDAGSSE